MSKLISAYKNLFFEFISGHRAPDVSNKTFENQLNHINQGVLVYNLFRGMYESNIKRYDSPNFDKKIKVSVDNQKAFLNNLKHYCLNLQNQFECTYEFRPTLYALKQNTKLGEVPYMATIHPWTTQKQVSVISSENYSPDYPNTVGIMITDTGYKHIFKQYTVNE